MPHRLDRLLLSCLHDPPAARLSEQLRRGAGQQDLTFLPEAAEAHGIIGYVHSRFRAVSVLDPAVQARLQARYRRAVRLHLAALADVMRLSELLSDDGDRWMVVDGPILPETVYPRPDLRSYDTMDLVVAPDFLLRFLDTVTRAGGKVVHRSGIPSEATVLVLWHESFARVRPDLGSSAPGAPAPAGEEIFGRSAVTRLNDRSVRSPSPVVTLVHLALLSARAGGRHLGRLKDIERLLVRYAPDWRLLIDQAGAWGAAGAIAAQLRTVRSFFGHPVPDDVLAALGRGRPPRTFWGAPSSLRGRSAAGGASVLGKIPYPDTLAAPHSPPESALLGLVQPHPQAPGPLEPRDWELVLELAEQEQVAPLVAHAISTLDVWAPREVRASLAQMYDRAAALAEVALEQFADVLSRLHDGGVLPIVLKGAALARWTYPHPALRPFTDIDLLVPAAEVQRTHDVLVEFGYRLGTGVPTTATDIMWRHARGYYDPAGTWPALDVHWRLSGYPLLVDLTYETIAGRCLRASLGGAPLLVPGPADTVILSSIYFLRELWYGKARLRYLRDLAEVLTSQTVDWSVVVLTARTIPFLQSPVLLALSASLRLWRTPVPLGVIATLDPRPSSLRRVLTSRVCGGILRRVPPLEAVLLNTGLRWLDNRSLLGLAAWMRSLMVVPRELRSSQRRWLQRLWRG